MMAWARWVLSAAVSRTSGSVVVEKAWKRQVSNSWSWPWPSLGFRSGMRPTTRRPGTCRVRAWAAVKRGIRDLSDLGPGVPGHRWFVADGVGVLDRVHASSVMVAIAALMLLVSRTVIQAACRRGRLHRDPHAHRWIEA